MDNNVVESAYPLTFRKEDTKTLGQHLRHRHSVDLVGMKRVGISNFLRYFLYHPEVKQTFISKSEKHIFIPVDLNDLVERELYPFWTLTFKRILDEAEKIAIPKETKQKINSLFVSSIQTNDLFLLIDGVRRSLMLLVEEGWLPTLFLLRFDRIKESVTPAFFDNLQGLRDATGGKLAYVFTSYRSLDVLSPQAFTKAALSAFCHVFCIKPCSSSDMEIISGSYRKRYQLSLQKTLYQELFTLVGGNVQYLQLALILLHERRESAITTRDELFTLLSEDERISLFSEELWESFFPSEKDLLTRIGAGEKVGEEERRHAQYLFDTGVVGEESGQYVLFSPLFAQRVVGELHHSTQEKEFVFSKKEHLLFTMLHDRLGKICEREEIIEHVWPEYLEFGVSDWSIDRLVARVRSKLKQQVSQYEIKTIRTRGYMLTERT